MSRHLLGTVILRGIAGLIVIAVSIGPVVPLRAGGAAPEDTEIPAVLYADWPHQLDTGIPVWLEADEAVDLNGRVTDRLPEYQRSAIESFLTSPVPGRCIEVTESYDNYPPLRGGTLAEAISTSDLVLSGTVTGSAAGFQLAEPGQLFRLDLDRAYKGAASLDHYYFFVPVGRFDAGPYEICKTDVRFPAVPEVGDEVLLVIPEVRNQAEHYLRVSYDGSLIVFRGAEVLLPRAYRDDRDLPAGRTQLLGWVEDRLRSSSR